MSSLRSNALHLASEFPKGSEERGGLLLLLASEVYVDDKGMAHDDEGNSYYVGKQYGGETYGGTRTPWGRGRGRGRSPAPRRTPSRGPVDKAQVDALEALITKRGQNAFLSSILSQVKGGKTLSDKQKKAVRQNLYRASMRAQADLFR
jgi:hypothetical protein